MNHIKSNLLYLTIIILFAGCKSKNKSNEPDSVKNTDSITITTKKTDSITITTTPLTEAEKSDSIKLTALVRALYKWNETNLQNNAFKPVMKNPSDTLYSGIDLDKNNASINDLKKTGMFTDDFLADYRAIAVRMDKELKDGSSSWSVGMLSEFQDNVNPWCQCQDPYIFWEKLKLNDIRFNNDEVSFNWKWGDEFSYKIKAKKEGGIWKISYMMGFDMNWYWWESEKKNKSNKQSTIH